MVFYRDDEEEETAEQPNPEDASRAVPLLPLRDIVVFPYMVVPLFVGRQKSIKALEDAMAGERELLLCAQREAGEDEPSEQDIHTIGTLGSIIQLLRLPDGTVKVLVEGKGRAQIVSFESDEPYFSCEVEAFADEEFDVVALIKGPLGHDQQTAGQIGQRRLQRACSRPS